MDDKNVLKYLAVFCALYYGVQDAVYLCLIRCSIAAAPLCLCPVQIRNEATTAGSAGARESIWQYFVTKCANNLHVVMAMSPVGDVLRTRCRNFPGQSSRALHANKGVNFVGQSSRVCTLIKVVVAVGSLRTVCE